MIVIKDSLQERRKMRKKVWIVIVPYLNNFDSRLYAMITLKDEGWKSVVWKGEKDLQWKFKNLLRLVIPKHTNGIGHVFRSNVFQSH